MEIKLHGWLCRSEGYDNLEFYEKVPKRIWGEDNYPINHWTYSEICFMQILPLELMPKLKWEDEPIEVELTLSINRK